MTEFLDYVTNPLVPGTILVVALMIWGVIAVYVCQ